MSFDILNPSTSINSHITVEASAGTGKTFTIEHLVARRLLETGIHGESFSPRDFGIITFTRSCANELSLRIRKTLDTLITCLEEKKSFPEYVNDIVTCGKESIQRAQQKLLEARHSLDWCTISTIHGLCLQLVVEYARETRQHIEKQWALPQDIEAIIDDIITYEIDEESICAEQLYILFKECGYELETLLQELRRKIWERDSSSFFFKETANKLLMNAKKSGYISEEVLELLIGFGEDFCGIQDKNKEVKGSLFEKFTTFSALFTPTASFQEVKELILSPLIFSEVFCELKTKAAPTSERLRFLEMGKTLFDPLIKALTATDTLLKNLAEIIKPRFLEVFRKKGLFHFEDCVERVLEWLPDPSFRAFLHNRFRVLIVDEFQDTDPIQWRILSQAFCNDSWKGYMYLVGDPKQAIYGFRHADVYCYMEAKKMLQNGDPHYLLKNFRSSPGMVAAQNAFFSGKPGTHMFYLPQLHTSCAPQAITSASGVSDLIDDKKAAHFFVAHAPLAKKRRWPTDSLEVELFSWMAEEILSLQKEVNRPEMAILVKDRYQALRLQEFFTTRAIPSISWCMHSLLETEAYSLLKRLLRWVIRPNDRGALVDLVANVPFLYSQKECYTLSERPLFTQYAYSLQKAFAEKGLGALFFHFLEMMIPPTECTVKQRLQELPQGITLSRDLDHLFDILAPHEEKLFFLEKLEEFVLDMERRDDDAHAIRQSPEDAVQILTVHRSKGLEFDVVFTLGLCSRSQDEEEDTHESDQEKIRQFYVAATRARKRTYFPVAIDLDQKPIAQGMASPMELFLGYVAGNATLEAVYESLSEETYVKALDVLQKNSPWVSVEEVSR